MPLLPMFSSTSSSPLSPDDLALGPDERIAMTAFLKKLVQTASPSTEEGDVAALIQEELADCGITDVQVDAIGNVIARVGDGDGPTLLYDAHMDTVLTADPDAWQFDPLSATIEDDTLYGLGACDMKGSIAGMVYAARRLVETGIQLRGTLILAFVVQEEPCEGGALKTYVQQGGTKPDWVLLGEPSDLNIKRGHRGRVLFKVTVHGKSSHGSRPDLGKNAITAASRLVFGMDMMGDLIEDPFLGAGTVAVTRIESRAASNNAIPDLCWFFVDRRLTLGETVARAQNQIENMIEREGIAAEVEVVEYRAESYTGYELVQREAFNPWALDEEHPLVVGLTKSAKAALGHTPDIGRWAFSTDGVYSMAEAGIPTVGFGPGDPDLAHAVNETHQVGRCCAGSACVCTLRSEYVAVVAECIL